MKTARDTSLEIALNCRRMFSFSLFGPLSAKPHMQCLFHAPPLSFREKHVCAGPKGVDFYQFWSEKMGCRLWPGDVLSTSLKLKFKPFWTEKEVDCMCLNRVWEK